MEMRAKEEVEIGVDITPAIPPLTAALYGGYLHSHCSSCFSPLPTTFPLNSNSNDLLYCSPRCHHLSLSAELHLIQSLRSVSHPPPLPSSDLRATLRLLHFLSSCPAHATRHPHRIAGLLTNRDKFLSRIDEDDDPLCNRRIHEGAKLVAAARRREKGAEFFSDDDGDVLLEEAALCLVLTNAVELQDENSRNLGIAVYDWRFSWINHSCSPNACYRFSFLSSSSHNTASFCTTDDDDYSLLRIAPHSSCLQRETESGVTFASNSVLVQGVDAYGPRMIVRSIKTIKKGEEVTITYTDLLQPKAIRQSDLWSKYQFVCCCARCSASPPAYIDHVLQEISVTDLESQSLDVSHNLNRDDVTTLLTDYIDEAITEYLSDGDPESCCEKLENVLAQGLPSEQFETEEGKLQQLNFRLHPLHHLALNSYTTLASAYKIRAASDLPEVSRDELIAFDMSRSSAAYSLLLAGAANYLFCSESSLIASVANFWTIAGESLLTLARSTAWGSFAKQGSPIKNLSSLRKAKCPSCSLIDAFEAQNADFERTSSEFLNCVAKLSANVWSFITYGCHHLKLLKDPIDFSWLGKSSNIWDFLALVGSSIDVDNHGTEERISKSAAAQAYSSEGRNNVLQLGVHCLLYGGFLATICYGENSHLSYCIHNIFERIFQNDS